MTPRWLASAALLMIVGCGASQPATPPRAQAGTISDASIAPAAPAPVAAVPDQSHAAAPPAPPPAAAARPEAPAASTVAREVSTPNRPVPKEEPERQVPPPADSLPPARIPNTPAPTTIPTPAATDAGQPPATNRYSGPSTGTIRWSGILDRDGILTVETDRASTGTMTGALPGVPVLLQMLSKDFTIVERPSNENNWRRLTVQSKTAQSSLILQWTVVP